MPHSHRHGHPISLTCQVLQPGKLAEVARRKKGLHLGSGQHCRRLPPHAAHAGWAVLLPHPQAQQLRQAPQLGGARQYQPGRAAIRDLQQGSQEGSLEPSRGLCQPHQWGTGWLTLRL